MVFSTEHQAKDYHNIESDVSLSTRLMYYDLTKTAKEYIERHEAKVYIFFQRRI